MKSTEYKFIFEFEGYSYFSKSSGKNTYHYKSKTHNSRILNLVRIKATEFYTTFNRFNSYVQTPKKEQLGQVEEIESPIVEEEQKVEDNDY